jgi:hypothetical protein
MMGSPIKSWEGVTAYFTGADSPGALKLIFVLMVLVTILVVFNSMRHEKQVTRKLDESGYS